MVSYNMRPQDVVVALYLVEAKVNGSSTAGKDIASTLQLSTGEISNSLARLGFAKLITRWGKSVLYVNRLALLEFLEHGLPYVFPATYGRVTVGMPTAASAPPFADIFVSSEMWVWPDPEGKVRGSAIEPLYPKAIQACKKSFVLYSLLAAADIFRVGSAREKAEAKGYIKNISALADY